MKYLRQSILLVGSRFNERSERVLPKKELLFLKRVLPPKDFRSSNLEKINETIL